MKPYKSNSEAQQINLILISKWKTNKLKFVNFEKNNKLIHTFWIIYKNYSSCHI